MEFQEQFSRNARPGTSSSSVIAPEIRPLTPRTDSNYSSPTHHFAVPSTSMQPSTLEGNSREHHLCPQKDITLSYGMPPPQLLSRHEASVQMYRSRTMPFEPSHFGLTGLPNNDPHVAQDRPSSTSQIANAEAIRNAARMHQSPAGFDQRLTHVDSDTRLESPEHLELALRGSSDLLSSRPGSSALGLPPLRKPRLMKDVVGPQTDDQIRSTSKASIPTRSKTLKRVSGGDLDQHTNVGATAGASEPMNRPHSSSKRQRQRHEKEKPEEILPKSSRMNELLYGRNATGFQSSSTANLSQDFASLSSTTYVPPRSPPLGRLANVVQPAHRGDPEQALLQTYAGQTLIDRQAALDDFMVANLETTAFTTLCEDIENCWRRVILGL